MKKMIQVVSLLLVVLMSFALSVNAQSSEDTSEDGPKIGLVLSGGGAKGLAHIGVLKILEEVGIYPDMITGTSMGSIVGGLYAMGYTASEIEDIANGADWDALLSNTIAFEDIAIEEKPYYGRFFAELPVIGLTPTLPRGLIEGQNLHHLLSTLTRNAHDVENFDELPIPFRCVATDIATGQRVVLNDGSLAEAIRASMAIPAAFSPVEINDRLLVDGGLVHNFPVQEALDMGADYIIGVLVSSDLTDQDGLQTLTDILIQSSFVMSVYDTREEKKLVDLLVVPDLTGFSTGSFSSGTEIIQTGLDIGTELKEQFVALKDSMESLGKIFRKPTPIESLNTYTISKIVVNGNDKISESYIRGKMELALPETVTVRQIESKIQYTFGTGYFSKITYTLTHNSNGHTLTLNIQEKPSDSYIKAALHYNNEIRAGINLNATLRNKLGKNSRFITEVDFSENFNTHINYLKYLGEKKTSAAILGYYFLNSETPFYDNGARVADFKNRRNNYYLKWQTTNSRKASFALLGQYSHDRLSPRTADFSGAIDKIKQSSFSLEASWTYNTLNKPFFPTEGLKFNVSAGYVFDNSSIIRFNELDTIPEYEAQFELENFFSFKLGFEYYHPISSKFTLVSKVYLQYLSEENVGFGHELGLGGFYENYNFTMPFWGAEYYEFTITDIGMAQVGLQYDFKHHLFAQLLFNYANDQIQDIWDDSSNEMNFGENDHLLGGGLCLGYRSIIGPILVNFGYSNVSKDVLAGINIGYWF